MTETILEEQTIPVLGFTEDHKLSGACCQNANFETINDIDFMVT